LQKITITVTFVPEEKTVIILEGYKTG